MFTLILPASGFFGQELDLQQVAILQKNSILQNLRQVSLFLVHLKTQERHANFHIIKPRPKHVAGTQAQLFALHFLSRTLAMQTDVTHFYLYNKYIRKHSGLLKHAVLGPSLIFIYILQKQLAQALTSVSRYFSPMVWLSESAELQLLHGLQKGRQGKTSLAQRAADMLRCVMWVRKCQSCQEAFTEKRGRQVRSMAR